MARTKPSAKAEPAARPQGGWFQTGYESVGEEVHRREAQQEEWKNQIRRFWMPEKEDGKTAKAEIVFVDGVPFTYREHQFCIGGSWRNWQTCLIGTGDKCPYDEAGNKNGFIGAYTVIDTRSWKGKDGTTHKNELALYPAKGDALKALRINAEERGGDIAGCVFTVSRSGDKSPSVGNVYIFKEQLPTKKITIKLPGMPAQEIKVLDTQNPKVAARFGIKGQIKPIDYASVLRPKTRAEALAWLGSQNISAGEESTQEVPY